MGVPSKAKAIKLDNSAQAKSNLQPPYVNQPVEIDCF
jgi:hypothetical protein